MDKVVEQVQPHKSKEVKYYECSSVSQWPQEVFHGKQNKTKLTLICFGFEVHGLIQVGTIRGRVESVVVFFFFLWPASFTCWA